MKPEQLKIETEINQLLQEGEVDDAARLAEEKGLLQKAIVLYEKCLDFRSLGRLHEKLKQLEKAMRAYEQGKIYHEAARVAGLLGKKKKAEYFNMLYQRQEYPTYTR